MTEKSKCKLVADTRERSVLRHEKELENVTLEIKQITIGDYAIISPMGSILAIIERKSLDDYAASLKDGRVSNKSKLLELRRQCNCRILYIIEGPAFPSPNDCFGNVPYRYIESSIFHLMIRDQIMVIQTENTLSTAKMLSRLIKSMDTLCDKISEPNGEISISNDMSIEDIVTNISSIVDGGSDPTQMLTVKHEKTDHDIVCEMWSTFGGIAIETASDFIKKWKLSDIIAGKIPITEIQNHKINGRAVNKKVIKSLTDINIFVQKKLLHAVPGISMATASSMLESVSLPQILSYSPDAISIIGIGKPLKNGNRRKLGRVIADRIIKLFNYIYESPDTGTSNATN